MERKVGEVFTCDNKTYQVVKVDFCIGCAGCAFYACGCREHKSFLGSCSYMNRTDATSIIFKLINNNMEIKNNQLTIDIPEGMEIDLENSDLAKGIIKFKEKKLCFNDILNSLRKKPSYSTYGLEVSACNAESLNALEQLMDIAKYYNEEWKPDWSNTKDSKYIIVYNNNNNTYKVDYNCSYTYTYNNVYFKSRKDAQAVIDNPNFRDILDTIYKN